MSNAQPKGSGVFRLGNPEGPNMAEPRGRPTKFTKALAAEICSKLSEGMTLREVCKSEDMPPESTVRQWAVDDQQGFSAQYARAREVGYHAMADELLEIADDGSNDWMERKGEEDTGWAVNGEHVQRSRLRLDTRKWMLSKALPKIYGDRIDVNNKHDLSDPMQELLAHVASNGKRLGQ